MANRLRLFSLAKKPGFPASDHVPWKQTLLRITAILALSSISLPMVVAQQAAIAQPAAAAQVAAEGAPVVLPQPTNEHRTIARLIARLMPQHHISSQSLNDTISERALTLYLKSLDPMKLYFLQSDINEFQTSSKSIDDMVQQGDLSLAYKIFGRFIQRVDERVTVALGFLDGEFDFNKD